MRSPSHASRKRNADALSAPPLHADAVAMDSPRRARKNQDCDRARARARDAPPPRIRHRRRVLLRE